LATVLQYACYIPAPSCLDAHTLLLNLFSSEANVPHPRKPRKATDCWIRLMGVREAFFHAMSIPDFSFVTNSSHSVARIGGLCTKHKE